MLSVMFCCPEFMIVFISVPEKPWENKVEAVFSWSAEVDRESVCVVAPPLKANAVAFALMLDPEAETL